MKRFIMKKNQFILHYLLGKNICASYGILNRINKYDIIHISTTDNGSSGSHILNLELYKVIGIHNKGQIILIIIKEHH